MSVPHVPVSRLSFATRVLALTLLAACDAGAGSGATSGDATTPSDTSVDTGTSDDTVQPSCNVSGFGPGESSFLPGNGDDPSVLVSHDGDGNIINVEFWAGVLTPGSYPLGASADERDYSTCSLCVIGQRGDGSTFFATAGTLVISAYDESSLAISGTLSDLTLVEVVSNEATGVVAIPDGDRWCVPSASFDVEGTSACDQGCPKIDCDCVGANDFCGAAVQTWSVSRCDDAGGCVPASAMCPTACADVFGDGWRWSEHTNARPTASPLGGSATEVTLPVAYDDITQVVRSGGEYRMIAVDGANEPGTAGTRILRLTAGNFSDVTPSRITSPGTGIEREQVRGLAYQDGQWLFASTRSFVGSYDVTSAIYRLDGDVASDIETFAGTNIAWFMAAGDNAFALGQTQTQPRTTFAGYLGAGDFEPLTLPSAGVDFTAVTSGDDGLWVAYQDLSQAGDASRVLARIDGDEVTRVGSYPSSTYQIRYANDRIYSVRPVGLSAAAILQRNTDGSFAPLCAPDASRVGTIDQLEDGTLFVGTHDAAYVYDGSAWRRLPVAVTGAFGTSDDLYGVVAGLRRAGINGKLYHFTP